MKKLEKQILLDMEKGRFKPRPKSAIDSYAVWAKTQIKDAKISLRLKSGVLEGLKHQAHREHTKYQTLIGHILEEYLRKAKAA
jgi:predicted DNA binding CopG/RHH family protein